MDSSSIIRTNNFYRDGQRNIKLNAKCNLLLVIIGLISAAQTILQIMFFNYSRNYIYFVSTALLGPFQLVAVFLAFCISKLVRFEISNVIDSYCPPIYFIGTN